MTPRWAQKLEVQSKPPQDWYSMRAYVGLFGFLAFVGGVAGRWLAITVLKLRLSATPTTIVTVVLASGLCLFGLWYVGKRWGTRATGALAFVVLGLFGTLTFSLLLALDP